MPIADGVAGEMNICLVCEGLGCYAGYSVVQRWIGVQGVLARAKYVAVQRIVYVWLLLKWISVGNE